MYDFAPAAGPPATVAVAVAEEPEHTAAVAVTVVVTTVGSEIVMLLYVVGIAVLTVGTATAV